MEIRIAQQKDLSEITEIFNEAIVNSIATFNVKQKTLEEQKKWYAQLVASEFPVLVAQVEREVAGWACLAPWSDRCAYFGTAEISTYVRTGFRGRGIGRKLKEALLFEAKEKELHTLISRIAGANPANEKINKDLGFEFIGTMREVGFKFGSFHDVHLFQKILR